MTAERSVNPAQASGGRVGRLLLAALPMIAGIYIGMRWHTTFERLLVPLTGAPAGGGPADPERPGVAGRQLWTCGMHPQVIQDHPGDCPICRMKLTPLSAGAPSGQPAAADAGAVVIDPAVVQNMGVRTAVVSRGVLSRRIRAVASVVEPEPARVDVNLRVSGWIQKLHADTDGMAVRKGEPLFELYSPELRQAIEELIAARGAMGAEPGGGGAGLISAAELRLRTLGLTPEQIAGFGGLERAPETVIFVSPIDGVVVDKAGVYSGSSVMAGQTVMRLADRSTMWVEARVPEGSLGRLAVGGRAAVRVDGLGGREFAGEVVFIHPNLDEMTRTAMVRIAAPNPDGALRRGMFAAVSLEVGSGEPTTIVPREAVIDAGETQVAFVSAGKGRFEPRRVVLGARGDGGLVEVASGLAPGDVVVTSGQFLIDSESRLREAVAKFLGGPGAPGVSAPGLPSPAAADARAPAALVDAVIAEYLAIAEPFGLEQPDTPAARVDGLLAAIDALDARADGADAAGLVRAAREGASAMRGQPIEKQRELLKRVSASIIAIVDAIPPTAAVAADLYIANCPMAKADWLQRTRTLSNPYYAEDMKECGTIVRRPGAAPAGGARGEP